MYDLAAFQQCCDVIFPNLNSDDLPDVTNEVFTRDLFGSDQGDSRARRRRRVPKPASDRSHLHDADHTAPDQVRALVE